MSEWVNFGPGLRYLNYDPISVTIVPQGCVPITFIQSKQYIPTVLMPSTLLPHIHEEEVSVVMLFRSPFLGLLSKVRRPFCRVSE